MMTIKMQRRMNATIHDEIILTDKDQINAQGKICQKMCRFTNTLT